MNSQTYEVADLVEKMKDDNFYYDYLGKNALSSSSIKHLLKRPEIKKALVTPIVAKNKVFGVLNLHTKKSEDKIESNIENLQNLSKIVASTI